MSNRVAKLTLLGVLGLLPACYHAVVETGRVSSGQEVRREWASSWLGGLVPPSAVAVAMECPNGVARVETKLSFLNQLAAGLTFGIYTPMDIRVQCAAPGIAFDAAQRVPPEAGVIEAQRAITRAAEQSVERGTPVIVILGVPSS